MKPKLFSSAVSEDPDPRKAIQEITTKIKLDLQGKSCDLALFFVSEGYEASPEEISEELTKALSGTVILGCNANGVISDEREIEMQAAITLLGMHLPDVKLMPFEFTQMDIETIPDGNALVSNLDLYPIDEPKFICLADPSSADIAKFLTLMNQGYPGLPLIGGLASGMVVGAENWLSLNGKVQQEGLIGVALSGPVHFDIVVSQGCRPIGEPFIITKSQENVLLELGGRPPLDVLKDIVMKLSPADQYLAQHSLFVGLAMDESRKKYGRGDFLIRNIMGADSASGAISVGEFLEPGQTLQFQLRDAQTSEQDLQALLKKLGKPKSRNEGAFLVSCCGRGKGLFGESDHDARLIQSARGPIPMTGFFANGEFGPIDKKNYVHGYTSSLTIIR